MKGSSIAATIGFLAAQDAEATRRDLGLALETPGLPYACAEVLLNLLEQRLEAVEVLAFLAIGDLLGRALLGSRADVPEFGDIGRLDGLNPELGQKLVIVEFVGRGSPGRFRTCQQPLMIERLQQAAAIVQLTKPIEAHGIQPLEDIASFPMLRRVAVLFDETLNLLEAGDDALFARRPACLFVRLDLDAKLFEESVILFGEPRHAQPPPSCGPGRPPPRPYAFPKRRAK